MKKLESTFLNMVLSLVIISVVAAGALAGVYLLTKANIEAQKKAKQEAAKMAVIAGHEDGTAVEAVVDGFGGQFRIMVGFDAEGNILGYEVLEHQETPGLGSHMTHWFKNADKPNQNIIGRKAGSLTVSKDGGDVDAITAATISSRAFLKAINQAYADFHGVEAHTGASQLNKEEAEEDVIIIEAYGEADRTNAMSKETEVNHE
ncbi:MAG: FMN-binding protein [Paludibacteraceae bacterium]|nr:FMN-binding protein [Paludibacteraceae bacterium]